MKTSEKLETCLHIICEDRKCLSIYEGWIFEAENDLEILEIKQWIEEEQKKEQEANK